MGNGAWGNPSNWSCNCVPTAADTVMIDHDSVIIPNGVHAEAAEVVVSDNTSTAGLAVLAGASLAVAGSARDGLLVTGTEATFRNDGLLKIRHVNNAGIRLSSAAIFDNRTGGQIVIDSIGGRGFVLQSPNFSNNGKITINQCGSEGMSASSGFSNADSILMTYCDGFTLFGPGQNSGTIIIDSTWSQSGLDTKAQFDNSGIIQVKRTKSNGIVCRGGAFLNDGVISISKVTLRGFNHESALTNNGIINIQETGNHGIAAEDSLTNNGKIIVVNASGDGIAMIGHQADFENNDSVIVTHCRIGITVDEARFTNLGYFQTESHTHAGLRVNAGTILNTGELVSISTVENLCIGQFGRVTVLGGKLTCLNGDPNIQVKEGGTLEISSSAEIESLSGANPLNIELGGVFHCDGIFIAGSIP